MPGNKKISIDKTKNMEITHIKKPLPRMKGRASVSRYVRMGFIKRY